MTQHGGCYPTRVEFDVLDTVKNEIAELIGKDAIDIIELGAGDGHKAQLIIDSFFK
ncbi:L-histidine N(alpha)-methyltransferase [Zhongshania sp.]|uniref:L-histidine N(alpha)-methyltransferase n=1 Tax=Zhongshania sp. TaxID=1971902 RepID=UPI0039E5E11E